MHAEYMNVVEELADLQDWCISEQGEWGVPVPYFVRKGSRDVLGDPLVTRWVAAIVANEGSDAWFSRDTKDLLPPGYNASEFEKGNQIFDIHFESGLSWDFCLNKQHIASTQQYANLKQLLKDLEPIEKPVQGRMARLKKPKAQALYSEEDVR